MPTGKLTKLIVVYGLLVAAVIWAGKSFFFAETPREKSPTTSLPAAASPSQNMTEVEPIKNQTVTMPFPISKNAPVKSTSTSATRSDSLLNTPNSIPAKAKSESKSEGPAVLPTPTQVDLPQVAKNLDLIEDSRKIWAWLGGGVHLIDFMESTADSSSLSFTTFNTGSYFFGFGSRLSQTFGFEASFQSLPGEVKSSSTITLTNGKFNWTTGAFEILVFPKNDSNSSTHWNIRAGIQQQSVPLIVSVAGSIGFIANDLTLASIGCDRRSGTLPWQTEFQARFLYPVSADSGTVGTSFSVTPRFATDALLGQLYHFKGRPMSFGVFSHAQVVNYQFHYDDRSTVSLDGSQTLIQLSAEARLLFEF